MGEPDLNPDDAADGMTLEMPFLPVQSKGGPHDDAAFAAGWMCGQFYYGMRNGGVSVIDQWVTPDLLQQLDLIAMKYGWRLVVGQASEDEEWVQVVAYAPEAVTAGVRS